MKNLNRKTPCHLTEPLFPYGEGELESLYKESLGGGTDYSPLGGSCTACGENLLGLFVKTGQSSGTGCVSCFKSFV